jgi:MFS family permease
MMNLFTEPAERAKAMGVFGFVAAVAVVLLLLGFGAGMALNSVLLAAMSDVAPKQSGFASGLVNTAFMMGGALGLAVLASLAASRSARLETAGDSHLAAAATSPFLPAHWPRPPQQRWPGCSCARGTPPHAATLDLPPLQPPRATSQDNRGEPPRRKD